MNTKFALAALAALPVAAPNAFADPAPSTPASATTPAALVPVPTVATEVRPILIGSALPKITLKDAAGKTVDLNASIGAKPAVLVFYRGGWCPFCNAHLAQLRTTEGPLKELGYDLIAISPDLPPGLVVTGEKNKLGYRLLSDNTMAASRALGISFRVDDASYKKYQGYGIELEKGSGEKHHQLPAPAVFIIGRDGTVLFSYVNPNYRVRLAPEILLAAAKAYKDEAGKAPS